MPRRPRIATGGYIYHVLNRGVGRMTLFEDDPDYAAFLHVLAQACERVPGVRLLGYCVMPNHWHLVLWPAKDGQLSEFMRWLTVTHTQRWHAHRHSAGTGPVYQGRFKSFPIQDDEHLVKVLRYVERNALSAELVPKAQDWRWGSLWQWRYGDKTIDTSQDLPRLDNWPVSRPSRWLELVNQAMSQKDQERVRASMHRGSPLGGEDWVIHTAARLSLASTLTPRGRPRKGKE